MGRVRHDFHDVLIVKRMGENSGKSCLTGYSVKVTIRRVVGVSNEDMNEDMNASWT
jgi:hypothetical protein